MRENVICTESISSISLDLRSLCCRWYYNFMMEIVKSFCNTVFTLTQIIFHGIVSCISQNQIKIQNNLFSSFSQVNLSPALRIVTTPMRVLCTEVWEGAQDLTTVSGFQTRLTGSEEFLINANIIFNEYLVPWNENNDFSRK